MAARKGALLARRPGRSHDARVLVSGQWALVTGASSGLGEQFARQLASRGLGVVLTARSVDRLESLAAELGSAHGVGTRVVGADLSVAGGIDQFLKALDALEVPIDHLVGNAGFGVHGELARSDPAEQRRMVTLNCEAIVALSRALVPGMIERGRGGVITVGSTAGFQPAGSLATYAASKAFAISFTEALHEELKPHGVRAMVLCPGPVPTGFQQRAKIKIVPAQKAMVIDAGETVRRALAAYEAGETVFVPGALNKIGAVLGSKAPRALVRSVTYRLMRTAKSDG